MPLLIKVTLHPDEALISHPIFHSFLGVHRVVEMNVVSSSGKLGNLVSH